MGAASSSSTEKTTTFRAVVDDLHGRSVLKRRLPDRGQRVIGIRRLTRSSVKLRSGLSNTQ